MDWKQRICKGGPIAIVLIPILVIGGWNILSLEPTSMVVDPNENPVWSWLGAGLLLLATFIASFVMGGRD